MIKLPDFLMIPYPLLEDIDIGLIDERLYGVIYWLTKLKNERCTANNTLLAELVKTTSGCIRNSLTKLEQRGYIKRLFKDEKKKIRSEILPLVVFSKVSPTDDTVSPTDDTRVSPTSAQNKKKSINKKNKEESIYHSESDDSQNGQSTNDLINLFQSVNPNYTDMFKITTQRKALEELIHKHGYKKIKEIVTALPKIIYQKYAPRITTPLQLKNKLADLVAFVRQNQTTSRIAPAFKPNEDN